jgi:signal transduction histidine kinase
VTDEGSREDALRIAWQRTGIARLAAIVAHDINNLVQVVGGYADILMLTGVDEAKRKEHLGRILSASKTAGALASQLLRFSRPVGAGPVVLDVELVLRAMRAVVLESVVPAPAVELRHDVRPALVVALPDRLASDVVDLVARALASVPPVGRLIVSTGHEGDSVVIRCADVELRLDAAPDPARELPV